jgi:probable F420-dependent oxidoreductase
VEIGIAIPHAGKLASPSFVRQFCQAAEEAGFDGLWTIDHMVAPRHTDSLYTLGRRLAPIKDGAVSATMGLNLEMNVTLAVAAAVTHRVRLGTAVAVLPIRNPVLNARQLASIDQYSGGRLLYGAGVGWLKEEADAMGMPWDRRGKRADEHIRLMRALWTAEGDTVEFKGEFSTLPPMDPDPRPIQRPIPILIGGHSDVALDRAARLGDGWIAAGMGPERLEEHLGKLRAACERHGRRVEDLMIVSGTSMRSREGPAPDGGAGPLGLSPDDVITQMRPYAELGVQQLHVGLPGDTPDALLAAVAAFGVDVLPALQAAMPT